MQAKTATWTHVVAKSANARFVRFDYPEAGGTGRGSTFGEIAVLRETSHNGNRFVTAFWRVGPATSPLYDFPLGDESGYVIRGSATIELLDSGETVELETGDLYSFRKGTLSRWRVHEPFEKFVVVADSPSAT